MIVRAMVPVAGAITGIIDRFEILQHYTIPQIKVKGGHFQHDYARPHNCFH